MFKYMKMLFLAAACTVLTLGAVSTVYAQRVKMNLVYDGVSHKYDEEEIKIKVNGKEITGMDVPAVSINGRTMVPARAIFEEIGAEVAWNGGTQEVYIIHDSDVVTLQIDSNIGTVNGYAFVMDTPAKIVNDRTLIPVRAAAEALKYNVGWDDATRTVTLDKNVPKPPVVEEKPENDGYGNEVDDKINTDIEAEDELIGVKSVSVPASATSDQIFTIKANEEIEDFETFILNDTRLVVDIYNAKNNVSNSNITKTNSSVVTAVRSGQFQKDPVYITRVVFDLKVGVESEVRLSKDKKSLEVEFETNSVHSVDVLKQGKSEIIEIYGDTAPMVEAELAGWPLRLIMDIPGAVSELDKNLGVSTKFISSMTAEQYDNKTVRITAELNENIEYEIYYKDDYAVVEIKEATIDNISFDEDDDIVVLEGAGSIDADAIVDFDDFNNGTYIFYLPDDYSDIYGKGTIFVDSKYIEKIEVGVKNGKTYIELTEKRSISVKVKEKKGKLQLQISAPEISGEKIVVIDAGHGLHDNGASANGLIEKEINLDIVQRLYEYLEDDENIKVYATRLDDSYPTNISRAQLANQAGADLFVSIHQNTGENLDAKGTEVLYATHEGETSGLTSKVAAQTLLKYVCDAADTENRGVKLRNDLIVLNQTKVPAVLIEVCFMTNEDDVEMIERSKNRDAIAEGIYNGIVDLLARYD